MKRIITNTGLILALLVLFSLNSCKKTIDPVVSDLSFSRAFTPVDFGAQISNITTVTLSWVAVKNVDHYVVEIYQGTDLTADNLVNTSNVDASATTFTYVLPAGDTQFTARINAISSLEGVAESKWISVGFKSLPENLFLGYVSELSGFQTCTVRWKPGSAITALSFDNGTKTSYPVTAAEATAGVKIVTGVAKGKYQISLMNTTFVRGNTTVFVEGDVLLAPGSDLVAAINAAVPGSVIILPAGEVFRFTINSVINKSIKIRAISNKNLPTLCASSGASLTLPMFLIDPSLTTADSIVFQNLIITGYINNNLAEGLITGVYDQGTSNACNIGLLKFTGCELKHFSRHLIRLRGTAAQIIGRFEVNDCILYDYGTNSTSYGIISTNTATGTIKNIKFSNSTIYNFLSYLVLYTNGTSCNSVLIDKCTLNQITYTAASTSRYIMDLNATVFTGGGVTISNSIFGSTAAAHTNGIRTSGTLLFTNTYCTSDYDDSFLPLSSVRSLMIAYSGASTALWASPVTNADFHFLDAGFAGKNSTGDPRWKP
jgi:hypothetical protein